MTIEPLQHRSNLVLHKRAYVWPSLAEGNIHVLENSEHSFRLVVPLLQRSLGPSFWFRGLASTGQSGYSLHSSEQGLASYHHCFFWRLITDADKKMRIPARADPGQGFYLRL